jgi:hypothetical protein
MDEYSNTGWDYLNEQADLKTLLQEQEAAGEQWVIPFSEVKTKIFELAGTYKGTQICNLPPTWSNYNYVQDSSNGCAAINNTRALSFAMELMERKGKEIQGFRPMEAFTYMLYHALIKKDYGYGGCTISGVMAANNKYGVLPYDVYGNPITDEQLVKLGWNRRNNYQGIVEKYGEKAEGFQVVTTVPDTFEDLTACLQDGYAAEYGTDKETRKSKDGIYHLTGRGTAHAMCYGFYKDGYFGHGNSYGDNFGWFPMDEAKKQWNSRYYDVFVILDIERTRKKINWNL